MKYDTKTLLLVLVALFLGYAYLSHSYINSSTHFVTGSEYNVFTHITVIDWNGGFVKFTPPSDFNSLLSFVVTDSNGFVVPSKYSPFVEDVNVPLFKNTTSLSQKFDIFPVYLVFSKSKYFDWLPNSVSIGSLEDNQVIGTIDSDILRFVAFKYESLSVPSGGSFPNVLYDVSFSPVPSGSIEFNSSSKDYVVAKYEDTQLGGSGVNADIGGASCSDDFDSHCLYVTGYKSDSEFHLDGPCCSYYSPIFTAARVESMWSKGRIVLPFYYIRNSDYCNIRKVIFDFEKNTITIDVPGGSPIVYDYNFVRGRWYIVGAAENADSGLDYYEVFVIDEESGDVFFRRGAFTASSSSCTTYYTNVYIDFYPNGDKLIFDYLITVLTYEVSSGSPHRIAVLPSPSDFYAPTGNIYFVPESNGDYFFFYNGRQNVTTQFPNTFESNAVVSVSQPRYSLYSGSADIQITPSSHDPTTYTITASLSTDNPYAGYAECDWYITDPVSNTVDHVETNGSLVQSLTYNLTNEGVYTIEYNCHIVATEDIVGSFTHTIVVPNSSVPTLSLDANVPATLSSEQNVTLSVHVVDENSNPVPGATVYVTVDNSLTEYNTTDSNGYAYFTLTLRPGDTLTVSAYKSGYHPVEQDYAVSQASTGGGTTGGGGGGAVTTTSPEQNQPEQNLPEQPESQPAKLSVSPVSTSSVIAVLVLLALFYLVLRHR